MFCTHCGSATSQQDSFCRACGIAQELHSAPSGAPAAIATPDLSIPLGVTGFFAGGLVGFLLRPSVFIVGQLPFGMVVTRGAYLTGLDQLLRPAAETSFNQMFAAAMLGALAGAVAGLLIKSVSARR